MDAIIRTMAKAGEAVFREEQRNNESPGRPFWDSKARKIKRTIQLLDRILKRARERTKSKNKRWLEQRWRKVIKTALRDRFVPAASQLQLKGITAEEVVIRSLQLRKELKKKQRFRTRKKRILMAQDLDKRRRKENRKQMIKRVLLRKSSGRDPFAAVVETEGETRITSEPETVKKAAEQIARDWFTSIRNER